MLAYTVMKSSASTIALNKNIYKYLLPDAAIL